MSFTLTLVHSFLNNMSLDLAALNSLYKVVKGTQVEIYTRLRCWSSDANASAVAKDCTVASRNCAYTLDPKKRCHAKALVDIHGLCFYRLDLQLCKLVWNPCYLVHLPLSDRIVALL
jgi:hypothetical protein